jgi:hypothetical protein
MVGILLIGHQDVFNAARAELVDALRRAQGERLKPPRAGSFASRPNGSLALLPFAQPTHTPLLDAAHEKGAQNLRAL